MRKKAKDGSLHFAVPHRVLLKNPFRVQRRCPFQNAKGLVTVSNVQSFVNKCEV